MTAEKIIEQIKHDSDKEKKQIKKEIQKQVKEIINNAKKEAESEAEKILLDGERQSENVEKILISKASQDVKREIMNAREKIIEECFTKALHSLSTLKEEDYKRIVTKLIQDGKTKLGDKFTIIVSRSIDREIAKNLGLEVTGTVEVSGGVILKSSDDKITLDNTFEGVIKRKKDEIRRKVGNLLFS